MPTADGGTPLTGAQVRSLVADCCLTPADDAPGPGRVGLESEVFPVRRRADGAPDGRVALGGPDGSLALLEELGAPTRTPSGLPGFRLSRGGRLVPEPGGQIEHATAAHVTAAAALDEIEATTPGLAAAYARAGVTLAAAGFDVWHPPTSVGQQLSAPRYPAMAAYLAARGPHGRLMMCHTSSLQVNLDLGPPRVAGERWLVANLAAPLLVATFANSPTPEGVSGRAAVWRRLDPTRTGIPPRLVAGGDDVVEQVTGLALGADVLLVARRSRTVPGRPGWRFGDWLARGDPEHGRPTAEDLRAHLTTLFPEIRARGFLEVRGIDALPARWRPVPVTLLVGLLYDSRARTRAAEILGRYRSELPGLLARAGTVGLADPAMCALAVEVWSYALAGAERLPAGFLRRRDLVATAAFLDRFTLRGRCPSDELRERLAESPAAALAWAAEPSPTMVVS